MSLQNPSKMRRAVTGVMEAIPPSILLELKLQKDNERLEVARNVSTIMDAEGKARNRLAEARRNEKNGNKINWKEVEIEVAIEYGEARKIANQLYTTTGKRIYLTFVAHCAAREFDHYYAAIRKKQAREDSGTRISSKEIVENTFRAAKSSMSATIAQGHEYYEIAGRTEIGSKDRKTALEESVKHYVKSIAIRETLIGMVSKNNPQRNDSCAQIMQEGLANTERICDTYQTLGEHRKALEIYLEATATHMDIDDLINKDIDKIENLKMALDYAKKGRNILAGIIKPAVEGMPEGEETSFEKQRIAAKEKFIIKTIAEIYEQIGDTYRQASKNAKLEDTLKHLDEATKYYLLALREKSGLTDILPEDILKLKKKIVDTYERRGFLHLKAGRFEKAREFFDKVNKTNREEKNSDAKAIEYCIKEARRLHRTEPKTKNLEEAADILQIASKISLDSKTVVNLRKLALKLLHEAVEIEENERVAQVAQKIADEYSRADNGIGNAERKIVVALNWYVISAREYIRKDRLEDARVVLKQARDKCNASREIVMKINYAVDDEGYLTSKFMRELDRIDKSNSALKLVK